MQIVKAAITSCWDNIINFQSSKLEAPSRMMQLIMKFSSSSSAVSYQNRIDSIQQSNDDNNHRSQLKDLTLNCWKCYSFHSVKPISCHELRNDNQTFHECSKHNKFFTTRDPPSEMQLSVRLYRRKEKYLFN